MHCPASTLLFVLAFGSLASAQTTLATFPGNNPGDRHHVTLGGVDLNLDGIPDLIVGAPDDDTGAPNAGRVYAYSGADSSLLWSHTSISLAAGLGSALDFADDYDFDTVPEVIIGAPLAPGTSGNPGGVWVLSGRTGGLVYQIEGDDNYESFGQSVAGGFDWNIDGITDFAVGAPLDDDGGTNAGSVAIFDGRSGVPITVIPGDGPDEFHGWSVAGVGDVDNDTHLDLAVGAPNADWNLVPNSGRVRCYSKFGGIIWSAGGVGNGDGLGWSVSAAGDANGDGFGDVLAGAPYSDDISGADVGSVRRFDGQSSAMTGLWRGNQANELFGLAVALVGDLDNDGFEEWAAGAPQAGGVNPGYVRVIDGSTDLIMHTVSGDLPGELAGWSVCRAGDFNQDGLGDVVFGARNGSGPSGNSGWARIFSGGCGSLVGYCTAGTSASGCQPGIIGLGLPRAAAPSGFTVRAFPLEGSKDGLFFYGWNGRQANSWGNGSSFQCVVPPLKRAGLLSGSGTPGACDGLLMQDLNTRWWTKPASAPAPGAIVQIQCWYRDPMNTSNQTTSLSSALEVIVCP